ncbi:hypothetical protein [Saccharomonospora iraqiensis]|nr:hypothetical protein [Saccharomonospora iraqiensis]
MAAPSLTITVDTAVVDTEEHEAHTAITDAPTGQIDHVPEALPDRHTPG